MAEFTLPKNSRITGGKAWPKPAGATETREFRVYRWNPDDGKNRASTPIMSTSMIAGRWCWTA
jgi:hypothetical protein